MLVKAANSVVRGEFCDFSFIFSEITASEAMKWQSKLKDNTPAFAGTGPKGPRLNFNQGLCLPGLYKKGYIWLCNNKRLFWKKDLVLTHTIFSRRKYRVRLQYSLAFERK